jgi:hypothetical protein
MQWWTKQIREGMNARSYLLVGVLVVVLLWIYSLDEKTRRLRARGAAGAAAPAASVIAAPTARAAAATPTPPGWGEDPFQRRFRVGGEPAPRATDTAGAPRGTGLFLQGIMKGPRGRTALVNGEVVGEGDRIGGREVLQIGERSVLILDQGTIVTLGLKGDGS